MTILVTIPWGWGAVGGVGEVIRNLLLYLAKHPEFGRPVLVTPGGGLPVRLSGDCYVDTVDLPAVGLPFSRGAIYWVSYFLKFWWRMQHWRRFMDSHDVTAVHVHPGSLGTVAVACAAGRLARFRPRVTVSFHGFDVEEIRNSSQFRKWVWTQCLKHVDTINACSEWLKQQLSETGVAGRKGIIVCHNGVEPSQLDREIDGKGAPDWGTEQIVLCVARYEWKKGIDVLIKAFDAVAISEPQVSLVVVGDAGPASASLGLNVASSRYSRRIRLVGPVEHGDLMATLRQCCIVVLPSRREPFGIVLLEAAWAGVAIVATRVGGIPEIVTDGHSGFLVPHDDPEAMAAAILQLLRNPVLRANLARNAKQLVVSRFTWERQAPLYLGLPSPPSALTETLK